MQAGLIRNFIPEELINIESSEYSEEMDYKYCTDGYTDEELLNKLFSSELISEPGTESIYSNADYSMIVEKITGVS